MLASRMRTDSDGMAGNRSLELNRLDRVDNPGLAGSSSRFGLRRSTPGASWREALQRPRRCRTRGRSTRSSDRRPTARLDIDERLTLCVRRIAVEGALPAGEVGNFMFDAKNGHSWL